MGALHDLMCVQVPWGFCDRASSDSTGLGRCPTVCSSSELPADAKATGHGLLKMISDALPQLLGPCLSRIAESWLLMYKALVHPL